MLRVEVKSASGLKNQEWTKKSDPYCIVKFETKSSKTRTVEKNLNPVWNQVLEFELNSPLDGSETIELEIKDENTFERDKLMGKASIPIRTAVASGTQAIPAQSLLDRSGHPTQGIVNLIVHYTAKGKKHSGTKRESVGMSGGAEEGTGDGNVEGEWDIIDNENEGDDVAGLKGLDSNKSAEARAEKFKRSQARKRLPNETLEFQVQVHCIEARRLAGGGGNINPSCAVNIGSQIKSTSSVDSSTNPVWDEILIFHISAKPAELFNTMVTIKVVNSKYVMMENLIGSFQMDVGAIYDEPEHGFLQKWILLTSNKDTGSGPKGFLKMSFQVVGPGDNATALPPYDPSTSHIDDIEGNLLRPAGVNLQPATFKLRIYRAEDIPQMDPVYLETVKKTFRLKSTDAKNLVDPYVSVSYAGHTVSTGVRWVTCNPEWNETLNLGTRFPSMSERIKIQLYDKDKATQDDIIGTAFLYLSNLSIPEGDKGFLPMFGPAWINFYGSTREFKHIGSEYEHLNEGMYEGVAYRGRLLMQLSTELGQYPKNTQNSHFSMPKTLAKSLKRHKHRVYVAFFHATQLAQHTQQVSFEVSIGSYGYREDPNAIPAPSTTQPTKPVSEDKHLYFLPWRNKKPCCVIPCYWENNTYRIECLNILTHIAELFDKEIESVKEMDKSDVDTTDILQAITNMFDNLSSMLNEPLPLMPRDAHTELDIHWRNIREGERVSLLDELVKIREDLTKTDYILQSCEGILNRIKCLTVESQISIPDVIIWMIHGTDRVAVTRIPAHEIFFSKNPLAKGTYCGKIHTRFLREPPRNVEIEERADTGAQVRLVAWMGRERNTGNMEECIPGGTVMTFAETYENQMTQGISWGTNMFGLVPAWSDSTGTFSLPKDSFQLPQGWRWDGEWFKSSAEDAEYDPEFKMKEIMEETFEVKTKDDDDQDWGEAKLTWEDEDGYKNSDPNSIKCTKGWEWKEDSWTVDTNRAVDEEGWEYGNNADLREAFHPIEREDSVVRRRKIVRVRVRSETEPPQTISEDEQWEYATTISGPFYRVKQITHFFRRRRWLKRMIATEKNSSSLFNISSEESTLDSPKSKKEKTTSRKQKAHRESPRVFMNFDTEYKWMLRAYIYQARTLLSGDKNGLSDPYAVVSFVNSSQKTHTINKTLCPTWNQTLTFNDVILSGEPELTKNAPPIIVIDFIDKDLMLVTEPLGQTVIQPEVRLVVDGPPPKLRWYDITHGGLDAGELLASFELILLDPDGQNLSKVEPLQLSPDDIYHQVPVSIRPETHKMRIEALLWGVRDMKRFQLTSIDNPFVRITCGDEKAECEPIKNASINPNFPHPSLHIECDLPKEAVYMPPLQIQVLDKRLFGRTPIVGVHTVTSLKPFLVHTPGSAQAETLLPNLKERRGEVLVLELQEPPSPQTKIVNALSHLTVQFDTGTIDTADLDLDYSDFDWWSRYYASIGDEHKSSGFVDKGYEPMEYFKREIEKSFENFGDRTKDFKLTRGKAAKRKLETMGLFKGDVKVYPLPEANSQTIPLLFKDIPEHGVHEVTVRVYVIKGKQLTPQDPFGKSDPYIKIVLGDKEVVNDKANYTPNNLNPTFGKMFEFESQLPREHEMRVIMMDHDATSADDLIGYTSVDIENRFLTSFQATCGIPKHYFISGPCKWRHQLQPSDLLDRYLKAKQYGKAVWRGNTEVEVCRQKFTLTDDFEPDGVLPKIRDDTARKVLMRQLGGKKQRLALYLLNLFDHVPDHIEERKLINPIQGDIPQGYLQMFVDIFPKSDGLLPKPVDISVREPEDMVLRIVVWNAKGVELQDNPIYQDEGAVDIYVKAFLRGQNKSKSTDVHYRSMDGEGMFNWRLVFPFKYLPIDQEIVVQEKEHFWKIDATETHLEPELVVQVWDNDIFLPEDFIGTAEFKLTQFFRPASSSSRCSLQQMEDFLDAHNLFKRKRMRGWWPVIKNPDGNNPTITGKVEMEIELLTAEEAAERPAGEGRDEPNANPHLDKPNRPATSFAWFTSPFKSFKFILWRYYKTQIILAAVLLAPVIILLIILL